jgi:hypothetical protein
MLIDIHQMELGGECNMHGEMRSACRILVGKQINRRDQLGDLGLEGKTILESVLMTWDLRVGTGFVCFRTGTSSGLV